MNAPIIAELEQGTYEWEQCRLGIPTASRFADILTPAKLQYSAQAGKYLRELVAEWLVGHAFVDNGASQWMDRGTELEPEARAWYEFDRGVKVRQVGFVFRSDYRAGGSPDGLVGDDGGLEIKNPALTTHLGYLADPDSLAKQYRGQVQGSLYITGRAWWDVLSYSPIMVEDQVVVRIEPDPEYQRALDDALRQFLDDLDAAKRQWAKYRQPRPIFDPASPEGVLSPLPGEEAAYVAALLERSLEVAHG